MTTYTWEVTNLYTIPTAEFPDYVVTALYVVIGVDGTYTATCQGSAQFAVNDDQPNFTPFNELTNEIVIEWIKAELGTDGINNTYANIEGQINSQKNPPVSPQNTPLPWN